MEKEQFWLSHIHVLSRVQEDSIDHPQFSLQAADFFVSISAGNSHLHVFDSDFPFSSQVPGGHLVSEGKMVTVCL